MSTSEEHLGGFIAFQPVNAFVTTPDFFLFHCPGSIMAFACIFRCGLIGLRVANERKSI